MPLPRSGLQLGILVKLMQWSIVDRYSMKRMEELVHSGKYDEEGAWAGLSLRNLLGYALAFQSLLDMHLWLRFV